MTTPASTKIGPPTNDHRSLKNIRVAALTTGAVSEHRSENHWALYLTTTAEPGRAIRLSMRAAAPDDPAGDLEWSQLSYAASTRQLRFWDFGAVSLTVASFTTFLYNSGYHLFIMGGNGSGCRHWTWTIISILHSSRYLQGDTTSLWQGMQFLYHTVEQATAINWVEGVFLKRPTTENNVAYYIPERSVVLREDEWVIYYLDLEGEITVTDFADWQEEGGYLSLRIDSSRYYYTARATEFDNDDEDSEDEDGDDEDE